MTTMNFLDLTSPGSVRTFIAACALLAALSVPDLVEDALCIVRSAGPGHGATYTLDLPATLVPVPAVP